MALPRKPTGNAKISRKRTTSPSKSRKAPPKKSSRKAGRFEAMMTVVAMRSRIWGPVVIPRGRPSSGSHRACSGAPDPRRGLRLRPPRSGPSGALPGRPDARRGGPAGWECRRSAASSPRAPRRRSRGKRPPWRHRSPGGGGSHAPGGSRRVPPRPLQVRQVHEGGDLGLRVEEAQVRPQRRRSRGPGHVDEEVLRKLLAAILQGEEAPPSGDSDTSPWASGSKTTTSRSSTRRSRSTARSRPRTRKNRTRKARIATRMTPRMRRIRTRMTQRTSSRAPKSWLAASGGR